jgi:hypothetical protein
MNEQGQVSHGITEDLQGIEGLTNKEEDFT